MSGLVFFITLCKLAKPGVQGELFYYYGRFDVYNTICVEVCFISSSCGTLDAVPSLTRTKSVNAIATLQRFY